jgi:hypothetical protein
VRHTSEACWFDASADGRGTAETAQDQGINHHVSEVVYSQYIRCGVSGSVVEGMIGFMCTSPRDLACHLLQTT